MKLEILLICSIIGIGSHLLGSNSNYTCTGWSEWRELDEFKQDLLSNYSYIKISDTVNEDDYRNNYNSDSKNICDLFNLKIFIRETTDKKKFYKLGVVKTAGIASLLGLTFVIAGTFVYTKRQEDYSEVPDEEPLITQNADP